MSDRGRSRSLSRSRSRSPVAARSPGRSVSRSRSPVRSTSRSPRGSPSRSPVKRSYSRSRSPKGRSRSVSADRSKAGAWEDKLDRLFDKGYVSKSELDDYTLDSLKDLSDELADCAVQRFSEANFTRINNKNGFLMGIIRRVKQDGPDHNNGDLESLPRPVRYKLQDLIDDKRIRKDDLDPRMCKALNELTTELGLEAVDKFSMANLDNVRSKTGFMMGIIKRLQTETAPPRYGGRRDYDRYDRDRGYDYYERDRGYNRGYDRYERDRGYGRPRERDRYY